MFLCGHTSIVLSHVTKAGLQEHKFFTPAGIAGGLGQVQPRGAAAAARGPLQHPENAALCLYQVRYSPEELQLHPVTLGHPWAPAAPDNACDAVQLSVGQITAAGKTAAL